jgi:hypothetical protein
VLNIGLGIGGFLVAILTLMEMEKEWFCSHSKILLFCTGLFLMGLSIIGFWVKLMVKILIRDLKTNLDNLTESFVIVARSSGITNRITRDFVLKTFDRDSLIDALLKDEFDLGDIQSYGFDMEFQKEFLIKAHARETERLKTLKTDKDESSRDK